MARSNVKRRSPPGSRRSFDRRWASFFLAELNGLADQRRLALVEEDSARALAIEERVRRILRSLAWAPELALKGAYDFARHKMDYAEDAWGPALVIAALESQPDKVRQWLAELPQETRLELKDLAGVVGDEFRAP